MVTFAPFQPSTQAPFQFQVTLDGQQYNAIVTWNLFGQRYYLNLYALNGTLIFSLPLLESPPGANLQSLSWDQPTAKVTAIAIDPHGFELGETVDLTIVNSVPDAYNGAVQALITGPASFTYPLSTDPGTATQIGVANYQISMTAGYFDSTLVLRNGQFEISP